MENQRLTPLKQEILIMICKGLTRGQICYYTKKSPATIEFHFQTICKIANVHTAVQLAVWAVENKLYSTKTS